MRAGDIYGVAEKSKAKERIKEAATSAGKGEIPEWLDVDSKNLTGKVRDLPTREQITMPVKEQLVVELYSK